MTWRAWACAAMLAATVSAAHAAPSAPLRVCADPDNLPFSNQRREGFENALAELIAQDLGRPLEYVWWSQRRGYARRTLGEARCDAWLGVASGIDSASTTRPYYRAGYVFVTRADRPLEGLTLDDARLRELVIGVQLVGDDGINTPPSHALARRGLAAQLRGFTLGDDAIVRAVAEGTVDVAAVWGPTAGYFAARSSRPLRVEAIPEGPSPELPLQFDIAMGVRKGDDALRTALDAVLGREASRIDALLTRFHVPHARPAS